MSAPAVDRPPAARARPRRAPLLAPDAGRWRSPTSSCASTAPCSATRGRSRARSRSSASSTSSSPRSSTLGTSVKNYGATSCSRSCSSSSSARRSHRVAHLPGRPREPAAQDALPAARDPALGGARPRCSNLGMTLIAVFVLRARPRRLPRLELARAVPLVALLTVFATGLGLLLSVLFVRYRDIQPIWDVVRPDALLRLADPLRRDPVPEQLPARVPGRTRSRRCSPRCATRSSTRPRRPPGGDRRRVRLLIPAAIVVVVVVLGAWVFAARRRGSPRTYERPEHRRASRADRAARPRRRNSSASAPSRSRRPTPRVAARAGARVLARPLAPGPQRADGSARAPPSSARSCALARVARAVRAPGEARAARMSRFSVVVPVLDGARYLAELLAGVRGQGREVEVLVIDSGSTRRLASRSRAHAGAQVLEIPRDGVRPRPHAQPRRRAHAGELIVLPDAGRDAAAGLAGRATRRRSRSRADVGAAFGPHLPRPGHAR